MGEDYKEFFSNWFVTHYKAQTFSLCKQVLERTRKTIADMQESPYREQLIFEAALLENVVALKNKEGEDYEAEFGPVAE